MAFATPRTISDTSFLTCVPSIVLNHVLKFINQSSLLVLFFMTLIDSLCGVVLNVTLHLSLYTVDLIPQVLIDLS